MRALLTIFALLLLVPATALASGEDVLRDCDENERIDGTYTQQEYRDALSQIATDQDEYSPCRDIIRRAQLDALGAGRGGSGGGGAGGNGGLGAGGDAGALPPVVSAEDQLAGASPEERDAVQRARSGGDDGFEIDGVTVDPRNAGTVPGVSQVSTLPTSVLILLGLLAAGLLAAGATRARSLVLARRAR
jgi:hypothetical protein